MFILTWLFDFNMMIRICFCNNSCTQYTYIYEKNIGDVSYEFNYVVNINIIMLYINISTFNGKYAMNYIVCNEVIMLVIK